MGYTTFDDYMKSHPEFAKWAHEDTSGYGGRTRRPFQNEFKVVVTPEYEIIDLKNCKSPEDFWKANLLILNAPVVKSSIEQWIVVGLKYRAKRTKKEIDETVVRFVKSIKKAKPVKSEIVWQ